MGYSSEQHARETGALANSIANKEPGAEARLFHEYGSDVLRFLTRLTGDPSLAEDLTQDTIIVVLQKLRGDGLREANKLSSYVYQTARQLYLGWLRKSANRTILAPSLDYVESGIDAPDSQCLAEVDREVLRECIGRLRLTRDRDMLTRHYVYDQSKDEICEALQLTEEQFDRVISRARHRLRDSDHLQALLV